jgi:hypothetical protein
LNRLANEAAAITKELGDVIFIGALATHIYTKSGRDSQDLDFVTKEQLSDDQLLSKGYKKSITGKQPWFSPRGIKIDIYTSDIPGIPFDWIVKNSSKFPVGKKGSIRVLGLESLIIAKHKAARDQDIEDLRSIAQKKLGEIDWNLVRQITGDQFMTDSIRRDMKLLST